MTAVDTRRPRGHATTSAILFLSLFAAQAGVIAVAPVLADLAHDLDVSTALAGQLRTITGIVAAATALAAGPVIRRVGLGRQLLAGAGLLALGSLGSAFAPTFALLALAQVPVGIAVGTLTTAGTLAAAEWAPAEHRTRVLSWALIGQPAAWIVGMPLVGLVGSASWRYAWVALPLVAALVAAAAVSCRAGEPPSGIERVRLRAAVSCPEVGRWLGSEALANTAWAGTIVFAGALFVETYGVSAGGAGAALAIGATAYVAGNRLARGVASRASVRALAAFGPALGVSIALFGVLRSSFALSVALFALAALVAGGRTLAASAYGLAMRPDFRPAVAASRAATMQLGYFAGAGLGGLALLAGGYAALGATFGGMALAASALLVLGRPRSGFPAPSIRPA